MHDSILLNRPVRSWWGFLSYIYYGYDVIFKINITCSDNKVNSQVNILGNMLCTANYVNAWSVSCTFVWCNVIYVEI